MGILFAVRKKPRLDYYIFYNFLNLRTIKMLAAVSRSAASLLRAGAPKAQQVIPALQAINHRDYAAAAPAAGHKGQIVAGIEGLVRGQAVTDTGFPIRIPVGEETLGRIINVIGDPIDERGPVNTDKRQAIHAEAPEFAEMSV